jgi:hypothetical protein
VSGFAPQRVRIRVVQRGRTLRSVVRAAGRFSVRVRARSSGRVTVRATAGGVTRTVRVTIRR